MALDPRQTVERLLRLATQTTEEGEARNAAMKACQLIVQHDLLGPARRESPFDGLWEAVQRSPARSGKPKAPTPPTATPFDPFGNAVETVYDHQGKAWDKKDAPRATKCKGCGGPIHRYSTVVTAPGIASYHETCWAVRFGPRPPVDDGIDDIFKGYKGS